MTDTKTEHNLSILEMLLHIALLIAAFMLFNPFVNFPLPNGDEYKTVRYYCILAIEVSTVFLLITIPYQLKVRKKLFFIIMILVFPTIVEVGLSSQELIIVITKNFYAPEIDRFFEYYTPVKLLPLSTCLAGYINKKLFLAFAFIIIIGCVFSFTWSFFLSIPLYWDHLLDGTFQH